MNQNQDHPCRTSGVRSYKDATVHLLLGVIACCGVAIASIGCAKTHKRDAPASDSIRDPRAAERLHLQAVELLDSNPQHAEVLLRQALDADLFHGPAHNNLGTLLLARGELYEAATNFEAARKLMPGHPDPRLNLALTYEKAARFDDAIEMYHAAFEVSPGHTPTLEALTRLEVTSSRTTQDTQARLRTIALEGSTPHWREWAQRQLVKQREKR